MKPVFADTAFFLALINPRDRYHQSATRLNSRLNAPLVTTAWVLLEFANAISASHARKSFERILVRLRSESDAKIIAPEPDLFDRGCDLYISRPDKDWSLTDCISFIVMEGEGLTDALTADRHFEQAGFKILLQD
ncbi:MAG: PIN domain-containing protein [Chthoniobacteraceae bacterium]|jgi:predicted nucleic acid-binding protein